MTFSIITPSGGRRPIALAGAIRSVAAARSRLQRVRPDLDAEMLIGFDGCSGLRTGPGGGPLPHFVRIFDLPRDGDYGNGIRNTLLKAAKGSHILFVDDDNALTPNALIIFAEGLSHDLQIAHINTSRAFAETLLLPDMTDPAKVIRQTNIDPLCICASRDLIVTRCNGWTKEGGYEADFVNISRYARRAASIHLIHRIVGIYDAGAGLDPTGGNWRRKWR